MLIRILPLKTALVIEDNEDNHALIRFLLERSNYCVRHCETGLAGVHLATSMPPNFIILDIQGFCKKNWANMELWPSPHLVRSCR